ncbi:MAG: hypothetical protein C5B49_13880 [Bdellovibrio sp.]|nr:MAG: hypothetical protein C5B49_13880 [Bdellovibrio sp.]
MSAVKERVLVGANSAILEWVARFWAWQGDRIFLIGRNSEKLAALATDLQMRGAAHVEVITMDLANPAEVWSFAVDFFGERERLDTLLVGCGVFDPEVERQPTFEGCHRLWAVNFESVAMILLAAKPHFIRNKQGTIAALSCWAGETTSKASENTVFGASKAALNRLMCGLRQELKPHQVHVCTIIPDQVDSQGLLKPEQVARDILLSMDHKDVIYSPPGLKWRGWVGKLVGGLQWRRP